MGPVDGAGLEQTVVVVAPVDRRMGERPVAVVLGLEVGVHQGRRRGIDVVDEQHLGAGHGMGVHGVELAFVVRRQGPGAGGPAESEFGPRLPGVGHGPF